MIDWLLSNAQTISLILLGTFYIAYLAKMLILRMDITQPFRRDIGNQKSFTDRFLWKFIYACFLTFFLAHGNIPQTTQVGNRVAAGNQVATMSDIGSPRNVHLHFDVIGPNGRINPLGQR